MSHLIPTGDIGILTLIQACMSKVKYFCLPKMFVGDDKKLF